MKAINKFLTLAIVAATAASCSLDLGPIDYYGSQSYWKTEANVIGYVDGLHKHLRDHYFDHVFVMGEVRSGIYVDGTAYDGMTTAYGTERLQNLSQTSPGFSNFDNIYGRITNCNLLLARAPETQMDENKRNYCLAIAHGLRALYYFDIYRVWGSGPLRLGVEVIDGELDPVKLQKERALPSEIMAQIKDDLKKSIELFGDQKGFNVLGRGSKCYWNKAATLCLAADVYMWNAKVACGDQPAVPADMDQALNYLKEVEKDYDLSMLKDFKSVFAQNNKANSEVIFAIRFVEGEATNSLGNWTYSTVTGQAQQSGYRADGTPWNDPFDIKNGQNQQMAYSLSLFNQFKSGDQRRDATLFGQYRYKNPSDKTSEFYLYGIHVWKNIGYTNSQNSHIYNGDVILYRLPWVYLAMAEAYNFKGESAKCAEYINKVRCRAYGIEEGTSSPLLY
ncbi:MAG: RagB/SusD family nutrient uptake outer membrane protein, partial [Bacteroidales bacterium]|nr:RagB/SusD family nutrient uptake outer membrane protein [Bacteroidales bacterium]